MPPRPFWEDSPPQVTAERTAGWTIPAIVRHRMESEADRPIYGVPEGEAYRLVTWRAFGRAVLEIAAGLSALGFAEGDRAAVMGEPTIEWVEADFGSLAAAGACVGVYQTSSAQEVGFIVEDCRPRAFFGQTWSHLDRALKGAKPLSPVTVFVLIEGEVPKNVPPPAGTVLLTLAELKRRGAAAIAADPGLSDRLIARRASSDLARIIYTSGTTGRPKGVMYTHAAWLLVGEQWVLRYPPLRDRQHVAVAFLSTAHVASAMVTEIVPLVSRLVPHFAPAGIDLVEVFRRVRPNLVGMTPRFYQKIAVQLAVRQKEAASLERMLHAAAMAVGRKVVAARWDGRTPPRVLEALLRVAQKTVFRKLLATVGLDRVARAQTGSAMMPVGVATFWAIWGVDIREAYGLSEAACAVCYQQNPFPKPGTIGRLMTPQPGTELELGPDGEILFKSPMLFSGYWDAPDATAKALRNGWFHTGDLAERTPDGDLRLIGRKNDAISTAGGKTINPAEIENLVKQSEFVSELIVFGHGEKYLTALVEIEVGTVRSWAARNGETATDFADLARSPKVVDLIAAEMERFNGELGRALQIKQFRLVTQPIDNVPGATTSAKKVKRAIVRDHFHELIETMYDRTEDRILSATGNRVPAP